MSSIREVIISTLKTDLQQITTANGYNLNVQEVNNYFRPITQIKSSDNLPAIYFDLTAENLVKADNNSIAPDFENAYACSCQVLITGYVSISTDTTESGLLSQECEKLITDIEALFAQTKPVSSLIAFKGQIPGVYDLKIKTISKYAEIKHNIGLIEVTLEIVYVKVPQTEILNGNVPNAPTFSAPNNGSTTEALATIFNWNSISTALSYHLQVLNSSNELVIDQQNILNNSFTIPVDALLINGASYSANVRAFNANGYSEWSSKISFIVNDSTVVAMSPQDLSAILWLDADQRVSEVFGTVTDWNDAIGHYNFTQTDSRLYPTLVTNLINGKSGIHFDSNGSPLSCQNLNLDDNGNILQINGSQQFSIMITYMAGKDGHNHAAMVTRTDPNIGGEWALSSPFNGLDGNESLNEFPRGILTYDVITPMDVNENILGHQIITMDNTDAILYLNGSKISEKNIVFPGASLGLPKVNIGSYYYYTDYGGAYQGYFFQIAFFNRVLTATEVSQLYAWHKQYYNV